MPARRPRVHALLIKLRAVEALLAHRALRGGIGPEEKRPRDKAVAIKVDALRRGKYRAASHKYRERKSQ